MCHISGTSSSWRLHDTAHAFANRASPTHVPMENLGRSATQVTYWLFNYKDAGNVDEANRPRAPQ